MGVKTESLKDPWEMPPDRRCSHRTADGQVCGAPLADGYNWCWKCREGQRSAASQTVVPGGALAGAWAILAVLCLLAAGVGFIGIFSSDSGSDAAVWGALIGGGLFWSMVCWTVRDLLRRPRG